MDLAGGPELQPRAPTCRRNWLRERTSRDGFRKVPNVEPRLSFSYWMDTAWSPDSRYCVTQYFHPTSHCYAVKAPGPTKITPIHAWQAERWVWSQGQNGMLCFSRTVPSTHGLCGSCWGPFSWVFDSWNDLLITQVCTLGPHICGFHIHSFNQLCTENSQNKIVSELWVCTLSPLMNSLAV